MHKSSYPKTEARQSLELFGCEHQAAMLAREFDAIRTAMWAVTRPDIPPVDRQLAIREARLALQRLAWQAPLLDDALQALAADIEPQGRAAA